jgi:hypothetical protein
MRPRVIGTRLALSEQRPHRGTDVEACSGCGRGTERLRVCLDGCKVCVKFL